MTALSLARRPKGRPTADQKARFDADLDVWCDGIKEINSGLDFRVSSGEGIKYAIRLPANSVLQGRIGYLLTRPVGRPTNEVRCYYANFTYQAGSWRKPCRVIAKVEWHPGELYPRVGFIVTNMSRPAERVVAFYNKRGTCEQWIKEGKGAIKWTRLSCRTFAANAVRL